ncbi:hypothetical protein WKH56_33075 [Priestia sp. SB1]|uniref:hypothetical protein n=1 Tax=Priestia sp. SB1 TaxID=3132359 RepID=UPI00316C31A1
MARKKKELPEQMEQGKKISGRKANSDRYYQLYEFLLFDPTYKKMTAEAKMLYVFLRNKTTWCEDQTEKIESGEIAVRDERERRTKSYRDEHGDIYCISDNTELEYMLNCAEKTLIGYKTELQLYGLLSEEPTQYGPNRLYVREPAELAERWVHINEINELRAERKEATRQRYEKLKENQRLKKEAAEKEKLDKLRKKQEAAEKKKAERAAEAKNKKAQESSNEATFDPNSKNDSYPNSKNDSEPNCKNYSKIQSNNLTNNLISKNKPNLSLYRDEVDQTDLPAPVKESIKELSERLIANNISILQLSNIYNIYADKMNALAFARELTKAVTNPKNEVIHDIDRLMDTYLTNYLKKGIPSQAPNKNGRTEMVPEWLKEKKHLENQQEEASESDFEEEKRKLEQELRELDQELKSKNNKPKQPTPAEIAQAQYDARQEELAKRLAKYDKSVLAN